MNTVKRGKVDTPDAKPLKDGSVRYIGTLYVQQPKASFAPRLEACHWCVAYQNMRMCNAMAPHCKLDHVFIRRGPHA